LVALTVPRNRLIPDNTVIKPTHVQIIAESWRSVAVYLE